MPTTLDPNVRYVPTDYRELASGSIALLAHNGTAIEIIPAAEIDDEGLAYIGENCCYTCDGMGHGYIIGWHEVEGKGTQPILAGSCPVYNT
jgi:hypothetical protein